MRHTFFYESFDETSVTHLEIAHFISIGLSTKSFRFFPQDDFSCSKSFFSIANFRPNMLFGSWLFIEYSVKKKVSSFVVYLLFYIGLKCRLQTVIFVTFYFITSEKVKTQWKLGKSCMMFMVKNHYQNASDRIGLLVFVPEILNSKMHHALDAQLKLTTTK